MTKKKASSEHAGAATKNLCPLCYRDHLAVAAGRSIVDKIRASLASLKRKELADQLAAAAAEREAQAKTATTAAPKNRCAACGKKVGLLGFACQCGGTFCAAHRHGDTHGCGVDWKAIGREKIAMENPLVIAPKLNKI